MVKLRERLDRRFYPAHADNWDDWIFRERIIDVLRPEHRVLDLGAGAGIVSQMNFRGRAAKIYGADIDPRVTRNPCLDEGVIAEATRLPFPDDYFDVAFADNVLEHLDRPEAVLSEIRRVLRSGGVFLAKTPNRWHYMPLVARYTPLWFHRLINRKRGRSSEDTFPTRYLANSRGQLAGLVKMAGLELQSIELIEGRPEYLRLNPLLYCLGIFYERLVNASESLARFRILIIATMRKP